ncbi:MAG: response regulator transcription factor [Firmicutes bacterium]|nr:response regulator transcription factor [Bacillota bacterium]
MTREMSDGEICRSFAAAKDKNDQIKVLAELNDCGVADIMQVLAAGGMISGLPKPKDKEKLQAAGGGMQRELDSAGRLKWTPELEKEIIKLFEAGLPNGEIAVKLGLEKEQVRTKRARLVRAGYLFGAARAAKTHKDKPEAGGLRPHWRRWPSRLCR